MKENTTVLYNIDVILSRKIAFDALTQHLFYNSDRPTCTVSCITSTVFLVYNFNTYRTIVTDL